MPPVLLKVIFFAGIGIMFYAYFGYAAVIWFFPRRKTKTQTDELPEITLVVPVFNEAAIVEKKIHNCLSLHYPKHLLRLLFVDDGSTDETATLIRKHPDAQLITHEQRQGKTAALNTAMQHVKTPLVVFTDASAMLHPACLEKMVPHFADETVGGISGEKKILSNANGSPVTDAEQLYWKYESTLKKADSRFYSVVGADGALFGIRTTLYKPVEHDVILDDFFISVNICRQGYRFLYEPEAFALEPASSNLQEEKKRKVRISAGCFQALSRMPDLLNPFRDFPLFLIYVSHRVLRWTACPLLLPVIWVVNLLLLTASHSSFYALAFLVQSLFYLLAFMGWWQLHQGNRRKPFLLPYYFVFMNLSLYQGFFRYAGGRQSVMWEKTERSRF